MKAKWSILTPTTTSLLSLLKNITWNGSLVACSLSLINSFTPITPTTPSLLHSYTPITPQLLP
ncbi:MAG: hypothetical protein IKU98_05435 [Bacteroidaceae bacterium]|nr:hypothetical protein [Bacteroidaceae bacterium]